MSTAAALAVYAREEVHITAARQRVAIFCVLASMVLVVLDAAITNVALPTMAGALGVDAGRSVWIVTAYQMWLLMALLPCAAQPWALGEELLK